MSFDNYSTDGAICPHCQRVNTADGDSPELFSENTCEWSCSSCGTDFAVAVHITHSWTTEKLESPS